MTFYEKYYNILNIDAQDLVIKELADHVLSVAEQYVYSNFSYALFERTITEVVSGKYSQLLYVSKAPIQFVFVVYLDNIPSALPTKYSGNKLLFTDKIPEGFQNVTIEYKIGYADPLNAPADIVNALFAIAKKLYRDTDKETDSYSSMSSNIKETIRPIDDIPFLARQTLFNYLPIKL